MFIVMVLVALDLDLYVYPRLFGYQTRWHIYLLALAEFLVTLGIVRALDGTLPLGNIVWYYLASWIGAQLLVNAFLPVLDVRWAEHGGELFRPDSHGRTRLISRSRIVGLAWGRAVGSPAETLLLGGLLFLTVLDLVALPTTMTPVDAVAGPLGAIVIALLARRLHSDSPPSFAQALVLGLVTGLLVRSGVIVPYVVAGAVAVACRAWLRLDGKPVFNSAACAMVTLVLFVPGVYTAEAQWGNSLFLPLVLMNLTVLVAVRTRTLALVVSFIGIAASYGWWNLASHQEAFQVLLPEVIPASALFFTGFVLIERATVPRGRIPQFVMGVAVSLLAIAFRGIGIGLSFAVALLMWNYLARLAMVGTVVCRQVVRSAAFRPPRPVVGRSGITRRAFLGTTAALGGAVWLGGSVRRLASLDPAVLSLQPQPVLAGGRVIPRFRDVARETGITFTHHGDIREGSPAVGTGIAWGDFDGDGRLDLYVTDHMGACHLYRNNGNGTFTDVAEQAGVAHPGARATSASFVDYDNDGRPDLYVGIAYGPNVLYHNNGDGTFTDVSRASGLADEGRTMSTAWADYDGDGFLDVFVANYSANAITFDANTSPIENVRTVSRLPRPRNSLYHNNRDGTFSDVTHLLGDVTTSGFGFSAVWFDYNNDGRPDLYVAYDFGNVLQPNTLWRNDGPDGARGWRFTAVEDQLGVNSQVNAMGTASADYNNDGWLDLVVSNIGPNMLYRNDEGRLFTNVARTVGVGHAIDDVRNMMNPSMSWGVDFADFNNDGWLDLYVVEGSMYVENVPQPNALFLNDRNGGFLDISAASGANDPGQGRSVAVADYDGDGRLDMAVVNYGQPLLLYRNLSGEASNNWLRLDLEGTRSNRDAVGARVHMFASGLPAQMREVQIGQGLGSCDARALHFGLGDAQRIDRIVIRWPSGQVQVLHNLSANRVLRIREPGVSRWRVS